MHVLKKLKSRFIAWRKRRAMLVLYGDALVEQLDTIEHEAQWLQHHVASMSKHEVMTSSMEIGAQREVVSRFMLRTCMGVMSST